MPLLMFVFGIELGKMTSVSYLKSYYVLNNMVQLIMSKYLVLSNMISIIEWLSVCGSPLALLVSGLLSARMQCELNSSSIFY